MKELLIIGHTVNKNQVALGQKQSSLQAKLDKCVIDSHNSAVQVNAFVKE